MPLRIDCHQHFWTLKRDDYGWLAPGLAALYRDFLPSDLQPLLAQFGIQKTVLVQAAPTVEETRYLLDLAGRHEFIGGVVGWVDMEGGRGSLDDLRSLRKNPFFLGVRPMIQDIADPAWMLRPSLRPVLDAIAANGLRFDALVRPAHLPHLLVLLKRHPNLRAVVDHGAKPAIAGGRWEPWASRISRIGAETSAYCKLSGLITEAGESDSFPDLFPYMDHLLRSFGPERVMWGSDWPVLNLRADYAGWVAATRRWLSPLTGAHREAIQGGNAARFYGLATNRPQRGAAGPCADSEGRGHPPDSNATFTERPKSASSR